MENSWRMTTITIDETKNTVLEFELNVEDFKDEVWFSADDYFLIKQRSRKEAKEWRKMGYGILVRESYENPAPNVQEMLSAFCKLEGNLTRRGLERQLSRQHGEERSDCKDRARHSLLLQQSRLKADGLSGDALVEALAESYENASHPARIFARRMGKGDADVVLEGEDNRLAFDILEAFDMQNFKKSGKMERRMSNCSVHSVASTESFDSQRAFRVEPVRRGKRRDSLKSPCPPSSPASPMEEYYAAIA